MNKKLALAIAALVLCFPSIASAHPGHLGHDGLTSGLLHPLSGLDHLLLLIGVGLLAVRLRGRAMWALPASLLAGGVLGGALAAAGVQLPLVETMIVASILACGLLIARREKSSLLLLSLIPLFGVFHGFAHLSEMSGTVSMLSYATGLAVASTAILGGAIATASLFGSACSEPNRAAAWRGLGGTLAVAAIALTLV